MSFLENLTALLPIGKKEPELEYFFANNIGVEKITAALWVIEGKELKVLDIASQAFSSKDEIIPTVDKLLDQVLGLKEVEPQKILFGVPDSWIVDDNLKDEHLKTLRTLVKELELTPMAYVASSHAIVHFLEKQEGIPTTAILIGIDKLDLTVMVVRAGKIDGVKVIKRGENSGSDIEKVLLAFTDVETLPSKILIYGEEAAEQKTQLMSFPWMSKLSFLHFPKIDILDKDLEIKSVCLAGGSEINGNISFKNLPVREQAGHVNVLKEEVIPENDEKPVSMESSENEDFGFVAGDVAAQAKSDRSDEISESEKDETEITNQSEAMEERELVVPQESFKIDDFEEDQPAPAATPKEESRKRFNFKKFLPKGKLPGITIFLVIVGLILLAGAYAFLPKANVKIFVEPKILEKDAQVIADPAQKTIDENAKIIPGQIVDVEVSGTAKDTATGKKQIGDPAKGVVKIYNATNQQITLKAGQILTTDSKIQFKLDKDVNIASKSASAASPPSVSDSVGATAGSIGADGNIPSVMELKVGNYSKADVVAKSEGNFSGGTSKDVTVVSSEDQQRLLAKLSSDLRQQAQQKLQEKYPDKKILQEALSENIVKKSYNKNINDQASEFSLNMTVGYKGTAFNDADLKTIVSKLVNTQVPDGFQLNIADTETQADVSKLEKGGKLVFLAKFRAKLFPKIDTEQIKNKIKIKTPDEVINLLKGMENILGAEISLTPDLPAPFRRLPILTKNINIQVGLK